MVCNIAFLCVTSWSRGGGHVGLYNVGRGSRGEHWYGKGVSMNQSDHIGIGMVVLVKPFLKSYSFRLFISPLVLYAYKDHHTRILLQYMSYIFTVSSCCLIILCISNLMIDLHLDSIFHSFEFSNWIHVEFIPCILIAMHKLFLQLSSYPCWKRTHNVTLWWSVRE